MKVRMVLYQEYMRDNYDNLIEVPFHHFVEFDSLEDLKRAIENNEINASDIVNIEPEED